VAQTTKHRRRRASLVAIAVLALALLAAISFLQRERGEAHGAHRIGLFTSLPILWAEADSVSAMLRNDAPPHWARGELEHRGALLALDNLTPGARGLGRIDLLVLAQPRPLAPDENVALDNWVRGGGRVLLFADPMLTAPSSFALGDKRRPQDIAMLSPILGHWGLRLEFDDNQPAGEHRVVSAGMVLPVNLPGRLVVTGGNCVSPDIGLVARCRIGKGEALVVGDAALLEPVGPGAVAERRAALDGLLDSLQAE
jgi:hypothetical protein